MVKRSKIIIFDVDGVLLANKNSSGEWLWQKDIAQDLGITPPQVKRLFKDGNWQSVLRGELDTREYFEQMLTQVDSPLPVNRFIAYWLEHDRLLNTEVLTILKSLRDYPLYLGTNQDRYRAPVIQQLFASYVDGMFFSHQIGAVKPDPAFYTYIESALKKPPTDIIFIDDSASHINAATQRGWLCHHYQTATALNHFIQNTELLKTDATNPACY